MVGTLLMWIASTQICLATMGGSSGLSIGRRIWLPNGLPYPPLTQHLQTVEGNEQAERTPNSYCGLYVMKSNGFFAVALRMNGQLIIDELDFYSFFE
jgi:hypothetical protein